MQLNAIGKEGSPMKRISRLLALLTAVALALGGCMLREQEPAADHAVAFPEPSPETRNQFLGERSTARSTSVTLYYATAEGAGFSTVTRGLRTELGESLLDAAVRALLEPSSDAEAAYFTIGDTKVLSCELACGIAAVNLSIDARGAQSEQELLALVASIGNTLLGIEGVSGVNVLVGGQCESFCRLPLGVLTQPVSSVTAAYAQLQADQDQIRAGTSARLTRSAVLYFPSDEGSWLVPELRDIAFSNGDFATGLIEALRKGPQVERCATMVLPEGADLLNAPPTMSTLSSGEHLLTLNFSSTLTNYLAFSGLSIDELLGSLSLTLLSFLPETDAVRVEINGVPIEISEQGAFPDGLIHRSDFAGRIGSVATLYLADDEGLLEPVQRAVSKRSALSPRRLLAELFRYADATEGRLTFPIPAPMYEDDVLGVQISGGVAQVNLSANFYRSCQSLSAADERCVVYAMVNTLCALSSVNAVRFYVEGVAADTLAGSIYLRSPLLPNPGIVMDASDALE